MTESLISLSRVVAIAHRGGSRLRPENTLTAFDHAVALGVDGVECDVQLSRDGEPVIIHDSTLDRTTDAVGPVSALTAAELSRVDAGVRFEASGQARFDGQGLGVPRLAELLDRHPALPVVIEIKGDRPEAVDRVVAVVRAARATGRVLIGGFDQAVIQRARSLLPEVPTSASRAEVQSALRRSWFRLTPGEQAYRLIQAPYRLRGKRIFGPAFVRAARRGGVPVQAWIIDDEDEMRLLTDWGVTGLISDRPDVAVSVAADRNRAARRPRANRLD